MIFINFFNPNIVKMVINMKKNSTNKQSKNPNLNVVKQYIKDLSFENPLSPKTVPANIEPEVKFDIELNLTNLGKNMHELNLKIKADAKFDENIIFLLELQYAGLFSSQFDEKKDNDKKYFVIEAAHFLFPFARSIIADITKDGGFNPLIIQPFDFEKIYKS